ncbi:MAG TPA: hypothetical protein VH024_00250 [Candidatus Angelobacter sp.]|jgi:hypothetical protein|nr:hypothetical protein [Candidatus Angelobacter sp.]
MTYIAKPARDDSRIVLGASSGGPPGQIDLYRIFYLARGRRRCVKRKTLDQALSFQRRLPFGADSQIVPVMSPGPQCRLLIGAKR